MGDQKRRGNIMNQIDVSHTIIAKSDQLNALDLPPSETIVKIIDVRVLSDKDQPVHLHLEGHDGRPYKPCLSMRRILVNAWGKYAEKWIGQSMALYCDQGVTWAGKNVGGIRIARLTGIERPVSAPIALNRSTREVYTVDPLIIEETNWQTVADDFIVHINESANDAEFNDVKAEIRKVWNSIPAEIADKIKAAIDAKKLPSVIEE